MQHELAPVRRAAMLEEIYSLPGPKHQPSRDNGNGELRLRERGSDMRRHVVGAFAAMDVTRTILGRDLFEKSFKICPDVGVGVFLNEQRCGGVTAENRQKTGGDVLAADPGRDLRRDFGETFAMSLNLEAVERLSHWNNQRFEGVPRWDFN